MKLELEVDEDIYRKFKLALELSGGEEKEVLMTLVKTYISRTFFKEGRKYATSEGHGFISGAYGNESSIDLSDAKEPREISKLRRWSINHFFIGSRIIIAYFILGKNGTVKLADLFDKCVEICKDKELMTVERVKNNYAQMKSDGPKSYGRFFWDDGTYVYLDDSIKDEAMKLKDSFLSDF